MSERLPMFPLGAVIFPFSTAPLRVFEPRYQQLLDHVVESDAPFGTVLIERGSEVGGGDQRFAIGTRLRVVDVAEMDDGQRLIVVAGLGRIKVERWLDDDPHPWAEVVDVPDPVEPVPERLLVEARRHLKRLMTIVSQLGVETPPVDIDLSNDPMVASYQLASLIPVTPIDAYRLLAAADCRRRIDLCSQMLEDQIELILASRSEP